MNVLQPIVVIPILFVALLALGYIGVPMWAWFTYLAACLAYAHSPVWLWVSFGLAAIALNLPVLRRVLATAWVMKGIRALDLLPRISETERAAIEAGNVWVDGELFSGRPDFRRMMDEPYPQLTADEQAFLDGPVERACQMTSDWEIYQRRDLPPKVWDFLKRERFLGLMIPPEYGGLGFSNAAYSAVMAKLASRSFTYVATVGVANSLGPAKLLLNYGTPAQKDDYLPRLARGEDIPCFALTEPTAGSDAASITSNGIVFKADDGKLYLRLNWKKRYITLSTIATLLGLAFQLKDPENLLGKGENVGITCALIPTHTPGVTINQRHDPMGVPFYNSPTEGRDVIVSIEQIVGGTAQAGEGWKMLMQTLAAGRGISFPATCAGVAKLVSRVTGAYATVRQQFGLSIGKFEGIEEPLARIGSLTYIVDAARLYTVGAVDKGEKPAVVSAIAKYTTTELSRQIINDGMDILGGAGICRGPRNLLANIYTATPISITVEGANILTRSLMVFGQGSIRCHPYLYAEIAALEQQDLVAFDRAFWPHIGHFARNYFRAKLLSLTRGRLARSPIAGPTARYYRKLAWSSAIFALLSDLATISFGGSLKRREKLAGRFADILAWMYLGTATLRRFEAEGRRSEDLPLLDWAMQYSFDRIQTAFEGILSNWSAPIAGGLLRGPFAGWRRLNPIGLMPSDRLGARVAQILQAPGQQRDRLTQGIYIPAHREDDGSEESLARLERAFALAVETEPIVKAIKAACKSGQLPPQKPQQLVRAALAAEVISATEAERLQIAEAARYDAIQVDAFDLAGDPPIAQRVQKGGFAEAIGHAFPVAAATG
ncbi:acyl-CoA dehydrogenase [Synechococcus sp. PCC 7336]|uniref:acyl-CoA dehydrogenase n=1 Tax=Synechococcus sp. PCC 7336 TaxID=195250 RepID=UPI00034523D3|nr:acyl-CoA dehydrogenase [Synechococcus sp. PCC 7336]